MYRGLSAIEKWHRERWSNNMRLLQIDSISIADDLTTVEGVVTSDRLRFWKLTSLSVRARFKLEGDHIVEARYGLKT